jgi:gamma-glutamylcyclotransferase (GGCT)/AIG2-like uncharacterized protein YtfP
MHRVFAYGSNMNLPDLRRWLKAEATGVNILAAAAATLEDHRLVFNYFSCRRGGGAANIAPATGEILHGVVLDLDDTGLAALDRKEGYPHHYGRQERVVRLRGGEPLLAWAYIVQADHAQDRFVAPTRHYRSLLVEGALEFGFPKSYVAWLETLEAVE